MNFVFSELLPREMHVTYEDLAPVCNLVSYSSAFRGICAAIVLVVFPTYNCVVTLAVIRSFPRKMKLCVSNCGFVSRYIY